MATLLPGVPYTAAEPDHVTLEVRGDRDAVVLRSLHLPLLIGGDDEVIGYRIGSPYFVDDFRRDVAPGTVTEMGGPWTDLATLEPHHFDSLGLKDGATVTRTLDRSTAAGLPWAPEPPTDDFDNYKDHPGTILPGICGAFVNMGTPDVYNEVTWSGLEGAGHHTEATPAVCVVPGTGAIGVGVWGANTLGIGLLALSCVAAPPEDFSDYAIDGAVLSPFVDALPIRVGILTSDGGTVGRLFVNRVQAQLGTAGFDPFPIPDELHGSVLHGVFTDQHMVAYDDPSTPSLTNMQDNPAAFDCRIFTGMTS